MSINISRIQIYVGIGFGVLIIAYGVHQMTSNRQQTVPEIADVPVEQARPADIVVATHLIPRGKAIAQDDVKVAQINGTRPANAEMSIPLVIGKYAIADIPADAVILSPQISPDLAAAGLAVIVPVGYRAVEMRTNDEIAVGNFLRAGDHVDIGLVLPETVMPKRTDAEERALGNSSEGGTVLQDVTILAVGDVLGTPAAAPQDNPASRKVEPPHAVTLAMTPDQITRFMLASSLGSLRLALRNPADIQTIVVNAVKLQDIRGATPPGAAAVAQGNRPIELIVGNKMHHIFSSNPSEKQ